MSLDFWSDMKNNISKKAKGIAFLCMAVYFASYIMRNNFAVMLVKICSDMNVEKSALAIVITGMTVAYGVGQVLSGFLGDRIPPFLIISGGLLLAVACNVVMFFSVSIPLMTVIWSINGVAHALLWPPIVKLLSDGLSDPEYNYAVVRVSWGSSLATILMYLICPLLLTFMGWRAIILLFAFIGAAIAFLWIFLSPKLLVHDGAKAKEEKSFDIKEAKPLPRYAVIPIIAIMVGIILQGVLRDGVTNWMPSLMNESFKLGEELSILSTVILAVFSMISFSFAAFIHERFFKNEVNCAAVIFAFSTVSALLLYLSHSFSGSAILSALLLALIVGGMHGINLMLITIVPKRFAKSGKVSTFSGILNACTYIGAAIATYGIALLAESFNWGVTILAWAAVALLGCIVCFSIVPIWQRFKREYAE